MQIERIAVEHIKESTYNPRQMSDKELERLQMSIHEFGFVEPLVWNRTTGNLVGGHQRLKVLKEQGIAEVECSVVELEETKEKALNLALNKISGEWDLEKLVGVLSEIQLSGMDIHVTGFDSSDINEVISQVLDSREPQEDHFDVNQAASEIEDPTTRLGDLWLLGRHRLLCGDATNKGDVERLMDGQLADMVFTDPPYNVNYTGSTERKLTIQNDHMDSESFYQFLHDSFANMQAVTRVGGGIYICHADSEGINFRSAMINTGWELKQCLIWVKNAFVLGRQDYQWKHEPILYGWKNGGAHQWFGGRKQSTVIEETIPLTIQTDDGYSLLTFSSNDQSVVVKVPSYEVVYAGIEENTTIWRCEKPQRNADHPTMKPIAIPAKAIQNSCPQEGVVLDPFLGSGSTLIAAEETGRFCYGLELDPVYCDVIVRRWEEKTGEKAVRADGATHQINS
ncbi:site-specific DNA-methyltransferase [Mechercharimyces sp. CAU 1602]|uniref:site-specific DNA-methyltransferase n=1 Tax=Mechercharimyces sp. CAU 1602 TaxID=2973933 RepID=UPI0021637780|nr:site-specific DNA-methyltransferase [Mechercharimyces sp. CAU 1602]MCS1351160.1 site-specific DNA-methyltransferase [Mechercharimyces sp. CAU 1602]